MIAQTVYNLLLTIARSVYTFRCFLSDPRVASYPKRARLYKGEATIAGYPTSPAPRVPDDITATRNTNVTARRVVAYLLDCPLVAGLSLVTFSTLLFVRPRLVVVLVVLLLIVLVFCAFYLAYVAAFDGFRGQTLGKMLCGIAVIRAEDGGPPGPEGQRCGQPRFFWLTCSQAPSCC
jgi:hypothetical protein